MAKIRVYELAKQLEIQSKDIIGFLGEQGIEVKSQSNIEDKEIGMIQKKYGKSSQGAQAKSTVVKPAAPKAEAPKTEAPKAEAAKADAPKTAAPKAEAANKSEQEAGKEHRPKKKSSITAVFNAQYSKQTRRPGDDRNRNNGDRRPQGNRPGNNNTRSNDRVRPIRPMDKPVGSRPSDRVRPIRPADMPVGSRPSDRVNAERLDRVESTPTTQSDRPQQSTRPQGDRPQQSSRPQSDRPQQSSRPQGQGSYSNNGRSENRPYNNNRSDRPQGNRPQQGGARPAGDRSAGNRPAGDRNNNGNNRSYNRNDRPQGQGQGNRNNYQGNRPGGDNRTQGGYNNNNRGDFRRPSNGRPGEANSSKFGNEAPKPTENRTNENRNRTNVRKNNGKNEHDALGSKKAERFVNLEKNGGKKKNKAPQPKPAERAADEILTITLPEHLTIKELADKMKVVPSVIVKKLFLKGTMVTVNQDVDYETAEEIALEFNCICEPEVKVDVIAELLKEEEESTENMVSRPPVVCVMGHVDHGKTSLLDAIRDTKVTDREAGGITQHIGAYMASINGQKITFLDTPGHEAFTAMRMRGANSTDIAILVVAADDGVMPQTVEAINHAKAAGIEIIVAINKIDKPNANIERVKQELSEYELIPEDWGGSTIFVPVSAHTHEGIDTLLEMILLTAEVCELKADPNRNARGIVIEAQLDKGRGAVATVLVQKGTLHVGDPIAAGSSYGKVRAMIDATGKRVKTAGPSTPVEILGLSDVPNAGEIFMSMDSEKDARSFAETFVSEGKNKLIEDTKAKMSLDDLFTQIQTGNLKELNIIVKADVQGSVEAVKQSLVKLSNDEVVVKIIHGGVGAINESDIILASASNAIIIGFNVRPDPTAKLTADQEGVDVRLYKVIYNAIEDVEAAMKGMLDPVFEEKVIGHAQVRQIFKSSDIGNIAGSYILDGMFQRGCKVRITREGTQIFEGDLASLKRFKDDVKEVKAGYECGLVFDGFSEIKEEDEVEAYIMVEVPR